MQTPETEYNGFLKLYTKRENGKYFSRYLIHEPYIRLSNEIMKRKSIIGESGFYSLEESVNFAKDSTIKLLTILREEIEDQECSIFIGKIIDKIRSDSPYHDNIIDEGGDQNKKLDENENDIVELKRENEQLKDELDNYEIDITLAENSIKYLENENKELKERYESIVIENNDLRKENNELNEEHDTLLMCSYIKNCKAPQIEEREPTRCSPSGRLRYSVSIYYHIAEYGEPLFMIYECNYIGEILNIIYNIPSWHIEEITVQDHHTGSSRKVHSIEEIFGALP